MCKGIDTHTHPCLDKETHTHTCTCTCTCVKTASQLQLISPATLTAASRSTSGTAFERRQLLQLFKSCFFSVFAGQICSLRLLPSVALGGVGVCHGEATICLSRQMLAGQSVARLTEQNVLVVASRLQSPRIHHAGQTASNSFQLACEQLRRVKRLTAIS